MTKTALVEPSFRAEKRCPNCLSVRVHKSHRRNRLERLLCALGVEIRRCHDCRCRQAWFLKLGLPIPTEGVGGGRVASKALLFSSFLLCFALIWWMISRFTELAG